LIDQRLDDLSAWVSFYSQAQIPVLRHTVHELDQLRENAENVNARVLAGIILRDPLMTLKVLAYIENHRQKRQTTDITTIDRALMMIGINPFFRDFENMPLVEDQLKIHPKALIGLLKVIARARKAAQWARDWAIVRHDLDVDEITIAALLHDVAEILMWCFAPKLAIKVRETQLADRSLRSVTVQTDIYGIPLYELKGELAKIWHLPPLLSMLLSAENADNPRVRNVKLAVDLARHSANGWNDAALPDDFRDIEELVHIGHENLMHKLGLDPETAPAASPPRVTVPQGAEPAAQSL
jgi:HD-like signal output (HDOD) protein